jgi:hypothetical protein
MQLRATIHVTKTKKKVKQNHTHKVDHIQNTCNHEYNQLISL